MEEEQVLVAPGEDVSLAGYLENQKLSWTHN